MTLIEAVVVIAVIIILAGLLLPALAKANKSERFNCISRMKQISLGLRMWANDNPDHFFPWQVYGEFPNRKMHRTQDFIGSASPLPHFLVASNEIGNPKTLACPKDIERLKVTRWEELTRDNISYFLNLDAQTTKPATILLGDRNLLVNGSAVKPGLALVTTNSTLGWTTNLHYLCGNIGLADGSVQWTKNTNINQLLQASGVATNLLVIP
ncbi:MAG: hypothetical protein WCO56_20185 [Verrucomicrobiota bacterium]